MSEGLESPPPTAPPAIFKKSHMLILSDQCLSNSYLPCDGIRSWNERNSIERLVGNRGELNNEINP